MQLYAAVYTAVFYEEGVGGGIWLYFKQLHPIYIFSGTEQIKTRII